MWTDKQILLGFKNIYGNKVFFNLFVLFVGFCLFLNIMIIISFHRVTELRTTIFCHLNPTAESISVLACDWGTTPKNWSPITLGKRLGMVDGMMPTAFSNGQAIFSCDVF